ISSGSAASCLISRLPRARLVPASGCRRSIRRSPSSSRAGPGWPTSSPTTSRSTSAIGSSTSRTGTRRPRTEGSTPTPACSASRTSSSEGIMTTQPLQQIVLAGPRGFCAGVGPAIDIVELALQVCPPPIYVRKEIVHNRHVVEALRAKGAHFVDELDEVPDDATVIFSAHGISPAVRAEAQRRGLRVIDATCPLVTKVHLEAVRYAREGYSIILVGHADHDEVVGTMGEAPDRMFLIAHPED